MKTESEGGTGGPRKGRFFDDLAGIAGGAFSAMAGARAEIESAVKSQVEMVVQRLELVRREDLDAALEVARRAREEATALSLRVSALEAKLAATPVAASGAGPVSASGAGPVSASGAGPVSGSDAAPFTTASVADMPVAQAPDDDGPETEKPVTPPSFAAAVTPPTEPKVTPEAPFPGLPPKADPTPL